VLPLPCGKLDTTSKCGCISASSSQLTEEQLFEKSDFKYEVGAAITLSPNGGHVLAYWGLDPASAKPVTSRGYELVSGDKLETQILRPLDGMVEQYGHPVLNFHRVDLHNLLKSAATGTDRKGTPARINLASKVGSIDCQNGTLQLENGQSLAKDLIVVADGVKVSPWLDVRTGPDFFYGRDLFQRSLAKTSPYLRMVGQSFEV
jgi:salicylate hydroxylase